MDQQIVDFFNRPVFETCKMYRFQCCHICEKETCSDNTNPLVQKIKRLEEELEEACKKVSEAMK
jgi:hypothetical protein